MAPGFHSGQAFLMCEARDVTHLGRGDVVLFDLDR